VSSDSILLPLARKLATRARLQDADVAAILTLPYVERTYEAPSYILREGEPAKRHCGFVVSGLAIRQKLAATGVRQIVSLHMAGDLLDLQHLFLSRTDHSIQALTRMVSAEIERDALQALVLDRPAIGRAMWIDALIDASIYREWVLNVGRRDARSRIAHLLCEFAVRMRSAGLAEGDHYELPMTQEQLGDAVGLTRVHVNRTLRSLEADGLLERDRRHIRFRNWERIAEAGDFSALYLHLDQVKPG
jgi:CRP-like cAMP-binding protein